MLIHSGVSTLMAEYKNKQKFNSVNASRVSNWNLKKSINSQLKLRAVGGQKCYYFAFMFSLCNLSELLFMELLTTSSLALPSGIDILLK